MGLTGKNVLDSSTKLESSKLKPYWLYRAGGYVKQLQKDPIVWEKFCLRQISVLHSWRKKMLRKRKSFINIRETKSPLWLKDIATFYLQLMRTLNSDTEGGVVDREQSLLSREQSTQTETCPGLVPAPCSKCEGLQENLTYPCVNCDIRFPSWKMLKFHKSSGAGTATSFTRDVSGETFDRFNNLQLHQRKHKQVTVGVDMSQIKYDGDDQLVLGHIEIDGCVDGDLAPLTNLQRPQLPHTPRVPQTAVQLNTSKKRKRRFLKGNMGLSSQKVSHLSGTSPYSVMCAYKCGVCGKQFSSASQLYRHGTTSHPHDGPKQSHTASSGINMFQCAVCDRAFSKVGNLQRHQFTHSQERPHQCEKCHKGFVSLYYLNRHRSTNCKSKVKSMATHQCSHCGDSFGSVYYLNKHRSSDCKVGQDCKEDKTVPKKSFTKKVCQKAFQCGVCGEAFAFCSQLKRHWKSHPDRGQHEGTGCFKCSICEAAFSKLEEIQSHQSVHSSEGSFQNDVCPKPLVSQNDQQRSTKSDKVSTGSVTPVAGDDDHDGVGVLGDFSLKPINSCRECGQKFNKKADFNDHLRSHMGIRAYKCGICAELFVFSSQLYKHRKCHPVESLKKEDQTVMTAEDHSESIFKCAICERGFSKLGNLERHQSIHDVGIGFARPESLKPYKLQSHHSSHISHPRKPNQCEVCGKSFASIYYLKSHVKRHFEARSSKEKVSRPEVICEVCGEKFSRTNELTLHKRKSNHVVGLLKCDECGEMFATFTSLSTHHKEKHVDVNPAHVCEICGKSFSRSASLNIHKNIHNYPGERPYVCDICGKGYRSQEAFKYHKMRHSGNLPHKCGTCSKRFSSKTALKIHEWLHSGEKPCKCKVCGKGFAQVMNLNAHQRLHTGSKPYKCDVCGVAFTYRTQLKRHEKLHQQKEAFDEKTSGAPCLPTVVETTCSSQENKSLQSADSQVYTVISQPELLTTQTNTDGRLPAETLVKSSVDTSGGNSHVSHFNNYLLPNMMTSAQRKRDANEEIQQQQQQQHVYQMKQFDCHNIEGTQIVGQALQDIQLYQNTN